MSGVSQQQAIVSSDVAFTPAVKEVQRRKGSRKVYSKMEDGGGFQTEIDEELAGFIGAQTSFFFATANALGQPYIQHRGGPAGFLRVLDSRTLGFADFRGNRQYISLGNLAENPKVHLFLIDYAHRARIKIWGEAKVVEDDPKLLASLTPKNYSGKPEQAMIIRVTAWDANCQQHIPVRLEAADVAKAIEERDFKIGQLEAEVRRLGAIKQDHPR